MPTPPKRKPVPPTKPVPLTHPTPVMPKVASTSPSSSVWVVVLVVLIVIGLGGGYYAYHLLHPSSTAFNQNTTSLANTNTDQADLSNVNYNATDVNVAGASLGTVTWQKPKTVSSLGLIDTTQPYPMAVESNATYYQVGTVKTGTYANAKIILMTLSYDSPQPESFYRLLDLNGQLTMIAKNSGMLSTDASQDGLNHTKFTTNATEEIPGLRFPTTLTGPKPRQTVTLDPTVDAIFSSTGLTKAFSDPTYGQVYTKTSKLASSVDYNSNAAIDAFTASTAFDTRNGYYLAAPDGTVRVYRLVPDILTGADVVSGLGAAAITWVDGTKTNDTYNYTYLSGCGSVNYINVVTPDVVSIDHDLQPAGTTASGDTIFELKSTQAKILEDFYTSTVVANSTSTSQSQLAYPDFINRHPMIFWVDPFGRLIQLTNTAFQPMAECGKPVIYLYPTATTNVDVTLTPRGGFTASEPTYNDGWHVTAQPNGHLIERTTGQAYPYLYWEGRGGIYTAPTQGFVVAQAEVHAFLTAKLHLLGLNDHETADFIEFWEPRMHGSPYYAVSFLGNRVMESLAPLTISPTPDSIIRILMDYRPLTKPVSIPEQIIRTPQRTGFTVVEWGGVLR